MAAEPYGLYVGMYTQGILFLPCCDFWYYVPFKTGPVRESNPGPRAPEARIIPLDQQAECFQSQSLESVCG